MAALAVYDQAVAAGARPVADLEIARLLLRHQKIGWALQRLRALEEEFPGRAEILELHYQTALANRLFDEARTAAEALLALRPEDARLLRHLGILEIKADRGEPAADLLGRAARLDPTALATWFALGWALELAVHEAEAANAYRRCLDLEPDDAAARWRLARLLIRQGAGSEARELLAGFADDPEPPTRGLYLLGSLETRLGDAAAGRRLLERHASQARIEARREHEIVRYNALLEQIVVHLGAGEVAEADRLLAELERTPQAFRDERTALVRSERHRSDGRMAKALEELVGVVRSRPDAWRYRYLLAEALFALGLEREARGELAAAVRLQPLALEPRRLGRVGAPGAPGAAAAAAAAAELELLERLAPGDEEASESAVPLSGAPRIRFLLDSIQLHPRARPPETESIPMD